MEKPTIDVEGLGEPHMRDKNFTHSVIYALMMFADLCGETRGLVEDERERRRIAFNRISPRREGLS